MLKALDAIVPGVRAKFAKKMVEIAYSSELLGFLCICLYRNCKKKNDTKRTIEKEKKRETRIW